jgi:hypothetical protein
MDDEDRVVCVEDVDDLKKAPPTPTTDHEQLFISELPWITTARSANHHLRFFRFHTVSSDMLLVPPRLATVRLSAPQSASPCK